MLKINDRVKVNIKDISSMHEEIDLSINGLTGRIKEINDFVYPYIVELDDESLNKLIIDTPRQFDDSELVKI